MLDIEDYYEYVKDTTMESIMSDLFKSLADPDTLLFPELKRDSMFERYKLKSGPTKFEVKLAAISEEALETFQGETLGSALKRHYTKLEIEKQKVKEKSGEVSIKRIKQDSDQFSLTELMANSKKSYFGIEVEKVKSKESPMIRAKPKSVKKEIQVGFLQDAVPHKFKIEDEKQNAEKKNELKRKRNDQTNETTNKRSARNVENKSILNTSSLTDDVVIRKMRIEKDKDEMIKAKKSMEPFNAPSNKRSASNQQNKTGKMSHNKTNASNKKPY